MSRYISLQSFQVIHLLLLLLFVIQFAVFKINEVENQTFDLVVKYVSIILSTSWLSVLFILKLISKDLTNFNVLTFYKGLLIQFPFLIISNVTFFIVNSLLFYNIITSRMIEFQSNQFDYDLFKTSIDGTERSFLGHVDRSHPLRVKLPTGKNYLIYKNISFNNLEMANIVYVVPYWKSFQPITFQVSSF